MKSWTEKIEAWFSAAAFAEAGEHETAMQLAGLEPNRASREVGVVRAFNRIFATAAFAEADCREMALEILDSEKTERGFLANVGLSGVSVRYGLAPVSQDLFLEIVGLQHAPVRYLTVRV